MSMMRLRCASRTLLVGCALTLGLATAWLAPGRAFAAYTMCRTDPVVTLSNGAKITLYATTSLNKLTDLKHVDYVLHTPKNASVTSIVYDQYGYLESVTVLPDLQPGRYQTITTVTSAVGSPVSITASVTGFKCNQPPQTINAKTGTPVILSFVC